MAITGIYKITNIINGKVYVGSAADVFARWRSHRYMLSRNRHHSAKLQGSWNKHGSQAFAFTLLEECDKSCIAAREQYWMDLLMAVVPHGYNILPNARTQFGRVLSPETKAKLSVKAKGRKMSEEFCRRMSESRKGVPQDPAAVAKRAAIQTGKRHSEETKQRLREIARNRPVNMAVIEKVAAFMRGKHQTAEHIAARVKAHLGAKRSPEARQRISEALRKRFKSNPPVRDSLGRLIKGSASG